MSSFPVYQFWYKVDALIQLIPSRVKQSIIKGPQSLRDLCSLRASCGHHPHDPEQPRSRSRSVSQGARHLWWQWPSLQQLAAGRARVKSIDV